VSYDNENIETTPVSDDPKYNKFAYDSLESVRKKLLDLSGRNTLLNYKHPKSSCIRLIDELPDQIYEVLDAGKTFTFIPVPEPTEKELIEASYIEINPETKERTEKEYPTAEQWAKYKGFDTRYDLPPASKSDDGNKKHHDTNLQTLLYAPELESRLRNIRSKSETAIEESGGNILYLALGFLEWYENRESDVVRLAPLFTLPVRVEKTKLDKTLGVYRYTLTLKDDGLLSNITLREKLANDFDIALPLLEDEATPESYFQKIQNTILKTQPRWNLRRQATLVMLNFSKQAMYQDLNPDNWPSNKSIDQHELIKMFFSTSGNDSEGAGLSYETEHPIDTIENIHESFPLIYDADSSQHSALIDAVEGHNLVIEGPPGSGKSQTITNLIAACIANGKKVLFVAEKMAALNVVKNRLDKAGLGDFCIELHSHKTHKLKILQDLSTRLNKQGDYKSPSRIKSEIERYDDLKGKLQDYVAEINCQWGNTGLTIHEILNKATRYREHYGIKPELLEIKGIDGESFTEVKQKELIDQADMLATIFDQVSEQAQDGCIENHFWYGVRKHSLKGYQVEEIQQFLSSWSINLKEVGEYWNKLTEEFGFYSDSNSDISYKEIEGFTKFLGMLPELDRDILLTNIRFIHGNHECFKDLVAGYKSIHENINYLDPFIKSERINDLKATNVIEDALKLFRKVGVPKDKTVSDIESDISSLKSIAYSLKEIKSSFDKIKASVPNDIQGCFEITLNGFNEFLKLTSLINMLPSDLWRHRNDLFDNPDIDGLLKQLTASINNLSPIHNKLLNEFSLHRVPNSTQLSEYNSILENSGFFRFFSSDWRNAKKSILKLSASPKPDKNKLLKLLPDLIQYAKGIEKINVLNKSDPILQELYKGIETPIDRINELRKWYQAVRDEYGIGFGERVSIGNALLKIDRNLAVSIADVANHGLHEKVNDSKNHISSLAETYQEYTPLKNISSEFANKKCPLIELESSLSANVNLLTDIIVSHETKIDDLITLNSKLSQLQVSSSKWLDNNAVKKLVSDDFKLSIKSGEYSEVLFRYAGSIVQLSEILNSNSILLNAVFNNLELDKYNKLKSTHSSLDEMILTTNNNAKLFIELGEVEISGWLSNTNSVDSIITRNNKALSNPNWLNTWLDYMRLKEKLYSQGLDNVIKGLESEKIETKNLKDIVQLVVFHQLSEDILTGHTYLSQFSGMEQMAIRKKFQEYDHKIMKLQRQKIAYNSSRTNPPLGNSSGKVSTYTETSLIKHESGKKTRHIAVRKLLKQSGQAIQALKPCFMMSPMSVAQYLIPGQFEFDLVVMDEASQIRPEDALGAIARSNKLVVVGDPKQLPPTSFFSKTLSNDEEDVIALEESESILESVIPMFKTRRLRWHYRSRHESLIAFSNQQFYDSNLILFPSPFQESNEFGIRFNKVERGRFQTGRNVEEAREVAAAAAKHLKEHSDESVGLVAMNTQQQAEIEMQLDQLAKDDSLLSDKLDYNRSSDEPLFIKNLENVQGDERDVIIISMTYGPEQIGGKIHQRFGPINTNVGWRRLNVLFTRSKKRMHIFSSMGSADILVSERSSRGVSSLRYFLEYCESGHLHHAQHTGKPADSDFEIAVMHELAKHGFECEPQVGVAGYFLDLAVKDPGKPGRFLMGVECDGATYHSAKSTRDRDRLRQDILESLGWRIRRIWSTDWFKNPQAQIQPIIQELNKLKTPIVEEQEIKLTEDKIDLETKSIEVIEEAQQLKIDDDIDLKSRLLGFSKNVIEKKFPDVDDEHRFLRPAMIEALLNHMPCSKAEFLEYIPPYLRTGTDVKEAKMFIDKVLEIIADYG